MLNMDVFVVLISVFMSMLPGNFFNWHLIKFGEVCKHRDRARERDLSIEWKMEKRNKLWLKIKWNISSGQSFIINNTLKWSEEKKTSKINGKRCIGVCVCVYLPVCGSDTIGCRFKWLSKCCNFPHQTNSHQKKRYSAIKTERERRSLEELSRIFDWNWFRRLSLKRVAQSIVCYNLIDMRLEGRKENAGKMIGKTFWIFP